LEKEPEIKEKLEEKSRKKGKVLGNKEITAQIPLNRYEY
jgi:hypothetical protein